MKKQLLIAAVAATMTSAAMADISISGNAKFEYQNVETTGVAINVNQTNTEVNLKLRGQKSCICG
jgi:type 1 fimbria pilin